MLMYMGFLTIMNKQLIIILEMVNNGVVLKNKNIISIPVDNSLYARYVQQLRSSIREYRGARVIDPLIDELRKMKIRIALTNTYEL